MTGKYSMGEGVAVARRAALDIEAYLRSLSETVDVENVEDDPLYRRQDVDLIWTTQSRAYKIEIKGDRLHKYGNFFFETISNREKGTPGCFLYTQADFLYYYFVDIRTLYVLPMPETRDWFLQHINRFQEASTTTPVGGGRYYTTVGRKVPWAEVLRGVPGVETRELGN